VSDNETKRGEDLSSDFHNDLYTFNFTSRRWFAAQLRPPKDYKQQQAAASSSWQQQQQQLDYDPAEAWDAWAAYYEAFGYRSGSARPCLLGNLSCLHVDDM